MNWKKISFFTLLTIIAFLSLKPANDGLDIKVNDKLGHFLAYFTIALNAGFAFSKSKWKILAIYLFFYSLILELLQYFVPGRFTDFYDLIANVLGILTGLGVYALINWKVSN